MSGAEGSVSGDGAEILSGEAVAAEFAGLVVGGGLAAESGVAVREERPLGRPPLRRGSELTSEPCHDGIPDGLVGGEISGESGRSSSCSSSDASLSQSGVRCGGSFLCASGNWLRP